MPNAIDITGTTFGRLIAVKLAPRGTHHRRWLCRCSCGNDVVVHQPNLRSGATQSCGCLMSETSRRQGLQNATHGMCETASYKRWTAMRQRCQNAKHPAFKNYGGRGITVCKQWDESFEQFHADIGDAPKGLSLDRIDNDGNYEPSNCRWATRSEQQSNQQRSTT